MAGSAAERQLTAPAPTRRPVRFAVAGPGDDAAIRQLLRASPLRGAISLSLEREPNYFLGSGLAGATDTTIVAYEHQRLVCMGRCTTRPCWFNGEVRRVGYLGELRLDPAARGSVDVVRQGYRFFQEHARPNPADFYFTSVAADNGRARRLLERGGLGLPSYEFLSDYVTLLVPVSRRPGPPPLPLVAAEARDLAALAAFLNTAARARQLAAAWTADGLAGLARHGLPLGDFYLLKDQGRIVACAALWDQRGFRQTVIRDYSPALAWSRPALNFAARLTGSPGLPPRGAVLAHAFVSPLVVLPDGGVTVAGLVRSLLPVAARRGLDFLTLGFPAGNAARPELERRFQCRTYASRLYRVRWSDGDGAGAFPPQAGPFHPEVALL